jgi:hypothetical protein
MSTTATALKPTPRVVSLPLYTPEPSLPPPGAHPNRVVTRLRRVAGRDEDCWSPVAAYLQNAATSSMPCIEGIRASSASDWAWPYSNPGMVDCGCIAMRRSSIVATIIHPMWR